MEKAVSQRDAILAKLRAGRSQRQNNVFVEPEWESDVFPAPTDLLATFKSELETLSGHVIIAPTSLGLIEGLKEFLKQRGIEDVYCLDQSLHQELGTHLNLINSENEFIDMKAAITLCECLVSRTGSVVVSSANPSGRRLFSFPPIHIVWAKASQLVPFVDDALLMMQNRYSNEIPSQITVITGASRTADIEKTLVMGAHGPKELLVLINSAE